jgi:O-antigen/teichoic acid export membrane protein
MVVWALIQRSVLALVAGSMVVSVMRAALSHWFLPGDRNNVAWDPSAFRAIVTFGRWIFISTTLTFLARQLDRLIFGKMVSLEMLGIYSIGTALAMLPQMALAHIAQRVMFPVYSALRLKQHGIVAHFERARKPLLLAGAWAVAGLVAGGPTAVELLYDDRYLSAGWIVQMQAFAAWLALGANTYGSALMADGQPKWVSFANVAKVVGMAALIPLGAQLGENVAWVGRFPGAVLGLVLSEALTYVVCALSARARGLPGLKLDALHTLAILVIGGAGAMGARALAETGAHVVVRALALAVGVTAVFAPFAWPYLRRRKEAVD